MHPAETCPSAARQMAMALKLGDVLQCTITLTTWPFVTPFETKSYILANVEMRSIGWNRSRRIGSKVDGSAVASCTLSTSAMESVHLECFQARSD
jgi:hypothetical protein